MSNMHTTIQRAAAALTLIALAACSGGVGSNGSVPIAPVLPAGGGLTQQNLVGVGDSLTFGEQSEGQMGDPSATAPGISALPGAAVPPTQENGFWALLYQQYTGKSAATTGVLPLIVKPGLGSQLVVSTLNAGFAPTHIGCDAFNQQAYSQATWPLTRMVPASPVANLGIPGATMHEAVAMNAPITGAPPGPVGTSCPSYVTLPGDPSSGGLQSLIQDESKLFYPVLGQFAATLPNPTMLNSAISLKPKVTTVWLGANDLLKFIFSHGNSPASDSPTQMATDLTQIITSLQASGSQVVVGDLPDILGNPGTGEPPVPQFFPAAKISADLQRLGVPAPFAGAVQAYVIANYTGATGFLTESGFFGILAELGSSSPTVTPNLDPSGPGSGDGPNYLDSAFSAQVIGLNAAYNSVIDSVATSTGVALAPVTTSFRQFAATGVTLAPGVTLTIQFGGGLLSYDGLHPSNTAYAVIANVFIGALDTKYNLGIAPLSNAQIGAIAQTDTYNPYVIRAVNPLWPYPLP
jgi:lysophospholipase L1-like esterase